MHADTLNAIINAFNSASDDPTRFILTHVKLSAAGDRVRIEATDGHVLSDVIVSDDKTAKLIGTNTYGVPRDKLPTLKLLAKAYKHGVPCSVQGDNLRLVLGVETEVVVRTTIEGGFSFPEFQNIWPKYSTEPMQVSFNPELLLSLFKAMRPHKACTRVTLVIRDKEGPIRVLVGENIGLLMPIRAEHVSYCTTNDKEDVP